MLSSSPFWGCDTLARPAPVLMPLQPAQGLTPCRTALPHRCSPCPVQMQYSTLCLLSSFLFRHKCLPWFVLSNVFRMNFSGRQWKRREGKSKHKGKQNKNKNLWACSQSLSSNCPAEFKAMESCIVLEFLISYIMCLVEPLGFQEPCFNFIIEKPKE